MPFMGTLSTDSSLNHAFCANKLSQHEKIIITISQASVPTLHPIIKYAHQSSLNFHSAVLPVLVTIR